MVLLTLTDVYYDVKPNYMYEAQACNCKKPEDGQKGCGDDCINRLVYAECSPQQCPLKDLCSNQKIQRHEWAPGLDRFMTKEKVRLHVKMESYCFSEAILLRRGIFHLFVSNAPGTELERSPSLKPLTSHW